MSASAPAGSMVATPSGRYAWYVVGLLTTAQLVSYIDRFLPSLLLEPIRADLHISQTQMGLILGPAFALFYAAVGLPVGWLADRTRRWAILLVGVLTWCAMTMRRARPPASPPFSSPGSAWGSARQ